MSKVVIGMTISLDGFVNDREGSVGRLYPDLERWRHETLGREEIEATGAAVMGKRTFAMAADPDFYADHYEFQVPIFVVTNEIPISHPKHNDRLSFTFVTDGIHSALEQAKAAAGDKDICVAGGANVAQQFLEAGLLDEVQLHLVAVILGHGLRLLENLGDSPIKLERSRVIEAPLATHLRYRVLK
jgi:dihydrofolate reductase